MKGSALAGSAMLALVLATGTAEAQRIGGQSGVGFANPTEKVEGPATIAGSKSYVSPLPYFRDLKPWDPNYKAPLSSDGYPDLQGVWSTASLTTMTRGGVDKNPNITSLVIPEDKVAEFTAQAHYTKNWVNSQKRTDPNAGIFTDKDVGAGYNTFWSDPGSEWAKVNTEWRSSWITSPANGEIPYSTAGRAASGARMAAARNIANTGPEIRTTSDRCLVFGGPGAPLSNGLYNNNYQIVQTPSAVVIEAEMIHDIRIVAIGDKGQSKFRPDAVKQWFGDSVGYWEGNTLVVVTKNLSPTQGGRVPVSPTGRVTERFTRVSDEVIQYKFEIDDPTLYTQVWTGEIPLRRSNERVFEYACHEGNYAMPGILRGDALGRDTAIEANGE